MATIIDPYTAAPNAVIVAAEINARIAAILAQVNGNVDAANLNASVLAAAGVSSASVTRRGVCVVPGSDTRTNTAYGVMPTPDRVPGIVLPSNSLLVIGYQAAWQESVAGAGRAAIFLGGNQLQVAVPSLAAPATTAAATNNAGTGADRFLATGPMGLASSCGDGSLQWPQPYSGDVTTGQLVGGFNLSTIVGLGYDIGGTVVRVNGNIATGGACLAFAAAGTYDVSVQFKSSSGSVTAKNRKLWALAFGF